MNRLQRLIAAAVIGFGLNGVQQAQAQEASNNAVQFAPQFNYIEAGMNHDASARFRSYTINNLDVGDLRTQYGGFHESYGFDGFFSRNPLWIGHKQVPVSAGIVQNVGGDGLAPVQTGLHLTKLPFHLYGFIDFTTNVDSWTPTTTAFLGKNIGDGDHPLSIWYFSVCNLKDPKTMYNELQANKNIWKKLGVGGRIEVPAFRLKDATLNANINWTF